MRWFEPGAVGSDPLAQRRRRPPPRRPTDRLHHHFAKKESATCSPSYHAARVSRARRNQSKMVNERSNLVYCVNRFRKAA